MFVCLCVYACVCIGVYISACVYIMCIFVYVNK